MRIDTRLVVAVLIVGAAASGLAAIYVGLNQGGGGGDGSTATGPPTVETECPDETVCIALRVVDADGTPVADRRVRLLDRGGSPDETTKRTDDEGVVRFEEGVGPSPCNRQYVVFPPNDDRVELGCNNGPETITRVVEVPSGE